MSEPNELTPLSGESSISSQGEADWNIFLGKIMNLLVIFFLGGGLLSAIIWVIVLQAKKKT